MWEVTKVSYKEHKQVLNVWSKFKMKDYQDLGLKCDVLLLIDVFEKFRNNSLINYGFFPSHYSSPLVLSWDEMLDMVIVKFELITDDTYIFIEQGMRGRISYVSNRYSKANKKYLKSYGPKQKPKHIIYLDANNLYGYALSMFLPTSGFKWTDSKGFGLNKYTSNNWKEFEVDLEYPKELQELHNDYPFASDKIEIKREMLSNY